MSSVFPCACCPCGCCLWRTVSWGLLPDFKIGLSMVWYWLYGLLVYFGMKPLLFSLCRYFLAAHSLSLGFEYASLCCVKDGTLAWSPVCLVLLFVPVALGDWPKKTLPGFMSENVLSSLFQESCGVLCFKSVRHFELILCVAWGRIPASLIHM